MGHQPLVLAEKEHQVAPVRGVLAVEIGGEDGKSGVNRLASAVDEGREGEDAVDEAEFKKLSSALSVTRFALGPNLLSVAR